VLFSAGPRVGIGDHFSMMEDQRVLMLARLLRRARFTSLEHPTPDPSATLRPHGSLPMPVTLR
jgi:cytochrome P450